jgi:hypothetical protein
MRKVSLSLGLWLLLLLGQHGAVLHELGHICRAAHTQVSVQAEESADKTCELCLGYSQLATPVAHATPVFLLERVASRIGTERPVAATPVELLTPRSRGPPATYFVS